MGVIVIMLGILSDVTKATASMPKVLVGPPVAGFIVGGTLGGAVGGTVGTAVGIATNSKDAAEVTGAIVGGASGFMAGAIVGYAITPGQTGSTLGGAGRAIGGALAGSMVAGNDYEEHKQAEKETHGGFNNADYDYSEFQGYVYPL